MARRRVRRLDGLEDMGLLLGAATPEQLWEVLARYQGVPDEYAGHAVSIFTELHGDATAGALMTARLMCTDRRWEPCSGRLVRGIVGTGILSADELDELAHGFVWSETFTFRYPVAWIGLEWVTVPGETAPRRIDPTSTVSTDRYIAPPLRRWGAERVVRSAPETFDAARVIATKHDARAGDAIVSGVIDAVATAHPELASAAVELGLGWPRGAVRLLALDLLARTDPDAARRLAATDPDKKVRKWDPGRVDGRSSKKRGSDQAELFDD